MTKQMSNAGAMLKDYLRDCRLGHCRHASCRRKADRRVAEFNREHDAVETVEFDPGFDVGATHKDWLREQRINRVLGIGRPRRSRRATSVTPSTFVALDKHAMREERLFGRTPLFS